MVLVGLAIALAVVGVVMTLSILPTGTSSGLGSAITQINAFMPILGIGIAVGFLAVVFGGMRGR